MDNGQKRRRQLRYIRDLAALTKSHQVPRAFRTFEYVEIFWIREIQIFGTRNKLLECLPIEASDAQRIGIMFQHVVLQRVEEESIVLVVIWIRLTLVHKILSMISNNAQCGLMSSDPEYRVFDGFASTRVDSFCEPHLR